MKIFSNCHLFQNAQWETVSTANWLKYPNELSTHIVSVDYLSRGLAPENNKILHTERLLTCSQAIPTFISRVIGEISLAYAYERSTVNLETRELTVETQNLTFSDIVRVQETCKYVPEGNSTRFEQEVRIKAFSCLRSIQEKLEEFSQMRFQSNATKGLVAMEAILRQMASLEQETCVA
jgi:hypothetical protein